MSAEPTSSQDAAPLTEEERHTIEHSLGLRKQYGVRQPWAYRNHYCCEPDDPAVVGLVARGFMIACDRPMPGGLVPHYVTRAGAEAAGLADRVRDEERVPWSAWE